MAYGKVQAGAVFVVTGPSASQESRLAPSAGAIHVDGNLIKALAPSAV